METCQVTIEEIADFCDGRADAEAAVHLRQHIAAGCVACRKRLADLERSLLGLRLPPPIHAPDPVQARARALFRERQKAAKTPWTARLVFDSRASQTPALARGEQSAAFQRLYRTEAHDIDLWEETSPDRTSYLIGQVLPHQGGAAISPLSVTLQAGDGAILSAAPDAGEFHLAGVSAGTYALRVRLPEGEILVPEIVVG